MEMKLHSVFLLFALGVVGLAGTAGSSCLVKNTAISKVFLYACFMSKDYSADVKLAPIDIPRMYFINSEMKVLRDRSFTRLGKYLERLLFVQCDIEKIEDNAFEGLTKLDLLAFGGSNLKIVKSAWFKGLSNLKTVSLQDNRIKQIEDNFFSILPALKSLDISLNEITCLPTASFGNFKTEEFHFRQNRLTPMCLVSLMNWLRENNVRYENNEDDYLDTHYDVTKICVDKLPKPELNEVSLNKCIEKTTRDFLPAGGNYTVKQVCELLKDAPSPFLNCTDA